MWWGRNKVFVCDTKLYICFFVIGMLPSYIEENQGQVGQQDCLCQIVNIGRCDWKLGHPIYCHPSVERKNPEKIARKHPAGCEVVFI